MIWTESDIEKVRKFIDIKNRGHYAESHELTSVYNRVLEKHVSNTTCGSCLRQRVEELERALRQYEADKAKKEQEALENAKMSGFNTVEEARRESEIIMQEIEERKKAHEASKQEEVDNNPQDAKEADTGQIKEAETKEENNDGTEGKSPATAKKGKKAKPKTA